MSQQADRARELAQNLADVRQRIESACVAAGRPAQEVTIVAITKTWPATDVRLLVDLGVTHIGENRDQEARSKVEQCGDLGITWHFVGQLQRNKAGSVARYAHVVQSIDRPRLVAALDRAAAAAGRRVGVCVQVDLDARPVGPDEGPGGRGGCAPADLPQLADLVAQADQLDLLGVMAVAPLGTDPGEAFDRLAAVHERLLVDHPGATMRSAGMSGDYEVALAAGATHIRLGSALLGRRSTLK
jgi:hypothetical protein